MTIVAGRVIVFWLAISSMVQAQSADISQRLRQILASTAKRDAVAEELRAKHYSQLQGWLTTVKANGGWQQSEVLALTGALAFLDGRMADAANAFRAADKVSPLAESDRFTLAMALIKLGDDRQATQVLTRLAKEHTGSAIYWYWLGRIDYDERRYTEAVEHLQRATALDAKSPRAWDTLGLAYDMQGKDEEARAALEEAARMNRQQGNGSPWPPHDLGTVLLRTGETKRAEQAFREALQFDPGMAQAHYHLGRALEKEGARGEALHEYLTAMSQDTQALDACYSLALLYRKMRMDKEAEEMFAEWRKRRDAPR